MEQDRLQDDFRTLFLSLLNQAGNKDSLYVAITSANWGEGCSTISQSLAATFSEIDRTVLVNFSFRDQSPEYRSTYPEFKINLSDLSDPKCQAEIASTKAPIVVIQANQNQDLKKADVIHILTFLRSQFNFAVFDVPPSVSGPEIFLLGDLLDGTLIVIEAGKTSYKAIAHLKETLLSLGTKILGSVLNKRVYHIPRSIYKKLN